jgi:flagellin-like hook-associated protein FlgL
MRVTANTYSNLIVSSSQSSQQQLATLQQEISTGNSIQNASDDPTVYAQAAQDQNTLSQIGQYAQAAATATTMTAQNNQAMTSLHQIVAQAGEYLASVTTGMSSGDLQTLGTEMQGLVTQLTSIVNQKSTDGTYLFGGTSNQPPISSTGTYNSGTNGDTTTIDVQASNPVQATIAAGSAGPPAVDGFLYDSSSGTDVLAALTQAVSDLNSGNASAAQTTDVTAVNKALNLVSSYVGSTAAAMSAVATASTQLSQQSASEENTVNGLVQTNLASASVQLQQIENQYQASLEAGTRVMNLSILNYMSGVSTS